MKRGLLAFTAAIAAAGVASAFAVAPTLQPESQPSQVAARLAEPPPLSRSVAEDPKAVPAKPTVEARQAPVPLLLKPHTPIEPPTFDSDVIGPETVKLGDGGGESAARAAVEADGYKSVKVLRKGANGLWYAEGLRGTTKVLLTVDAQGTVSAQ